MMTDTAADRNLLHIPNEILIDIILYFNARERVALGGSCQRLNSLVFQDKKTLRDLDFSEDGYLTSMSDVQQYFNNKTKYDHIRKLNISDVYCERPAQMLCYISKAKNLIEVNMTGIKFKNHEHFSQFLKPLENLKKFSGDWPSDLKPSLLEPFKKRFKRLTHLSITLSSAIDKWMLFPALELCEELEELRMLQTSEYSTRHIAPIQMTQRMKKLRLVTYYGCDAPLVENVVMKLLPDPEQWMLFEFFDTRNKRYFHYEKNVKVSEELREGVHTGMRCRPIFKHALREGWSLDVKSLLENVVCISRHMDPDNLHSSGKYKYPSTCLLRIVDTKLLLENPRQQIFYLNLVDDITPECDIQLVTSTFPSLTKLVLSRVTKKEAPRLRSETSHLESGFKRKRVAFQEQNEKQDPHSSFKKLVESTPQLRDLTLCDGNLEGRETWDLMALQLVSGWKHLTTLYLANLPIRSGQFLIEIGKRCVNLEKLRLENLGTRIACCYKNALLQMLPQCLNLKDFSIEQTNIGQVSHIIYTLTNNTKLRRVRVKSLGTGNDISNPIPSIMRLIRATRLILLVYEVEAVTQAACDKLRSVLQRLKIDLDRPHFQFAVSRNISSEKCISQFSHLELVHKDLLLPHSYIDTVFRLNLS